MSEDIQNYIKELEGHIQSQEQAMHSQNQNQNLLLQQQEEKSIIKEQLDSGEDLERIEHLLRSEIVLKKPEGDEWVTPTDRNMVILSEYGVQLILNAISFEINKNKLLSNYDEKTINSKMEDFSTDLTDTIFMETEKVFEQPTMGDCMVVLTDRINKKAQLRSYSLQLMGKEVNQEQITKDILNEMEDKVEKELELIRQTIMKNKYKRFILIMRLVQDTVHDTYLRALAGVERRSLRQHINISEVQTLGNPQMQQKKDSKWYNPLSWRQR